MYPRKHHYIPIFYLKQWAQNGKICEFSRPHQDVKPMMKHPSAAGYEFDLYTIKGAAPSIAQSLETDFLKVVDQLASNALRALINKEVLNLNPDERSGWSRFIMSLLHRTPEKIQWLRAALLREADRNMLNAEEEYLSVREPSDPKNVADFIRQQPTLAYEATLNKLLYLIMDSQKVGSFICQMRWSVYTVNNNNYYSFLTSDRPLIMTNGMAYSHSFLAIPLSPSHLFLATNNIENEQTIQNISHRELVKNMNNILCLQAAKYVYGSDDSQLRFVSNRLGRGKPQLFHGKSE